MLTFLTAHPAVFFMVLLALLLVIVYLAKVAVDLGAEPNGSIVSVINLVFTTSISVALLTEPSTYTVHGLQAVALFFCIGLLPLAVFERYVRDILDGRSDRA